MKRSAEIFMVACFIIFLIGVMSATILRETETYSYFENRILAKFPEYSAQSAGDGSYVLQLERYLADHAAFRTTLLRVKARIDLTLQRLVVNDVVRTENRLLPYLPPETVVPGTINAQAEAMADNLKRISNTVQEYGGYYCYVAVPCQYAYFEQDYPWYLNNRSELSRLSVSALSQALKERGVSFLDVRASFDELGHPDNYGSKVDNHYTMQGVLRHTSLLWKRQQRKAD